MTDVSKRGLRDWTRVNMGDDHEVRYWTDALHCTKEELKAAVDYLARRKRRWRRDQRARGSPRARLSRVAGSTRSSGLRCRDTRCS